MDLTCYEYFHIYGSNYQIFLQRARELDKLKLGARKKEVEKSWWRRAAEEAELVLSESEGESEAEYEDRGGKTKVSMVARWLYPNF